MLSIANERAAVELNVTLALLNGIVLCIPANPPAKTGSGAPLYEREPTFVVPLNKSIVVAFATENVVRTANPYPNELMEDGNVRVRTPELPPGPETMFRG